MKVRRLYEKFTVDMLEDGQLLLGLVTEQQFIDMVNAALSDFLKETCIVSRIWTMSVNSGVPTYTIPDNFVRVDNVFLAGRFIPRSSIMELNNSMRDWRRKAGPPRFWYEDGLPSKTIGLAPAPDYNSAYILGPHEPAAPHGQFDSFSQMAIPSYTSTPTFMRPDQHRGLTVIGPCLYSTSDVDGDYYLPVQSLDDDIPRISGAPGDHPPMVPDDYLSGYLLFDVLNRIYAGDNEAKDTQKAAYCAAQYREGIALGKEITGEANVE